jgi:hypothetical protein
MGLDGIGFHAIGEMILGAPIIVYNLVSKISASAVLASPPLVDLSLALLWDDGDAVLWDSGDAVLWE